MIIYYLPSGQIAINPLTGKLLDGDVKLQTEMTFKNIMAILNEANLDKKHIVTYTLSALAKEQLMASEHAEKAIKKYNIDQTKIFPTKL